jgi:hypothetical protein
MLKSFLSKREALLQMGLQENDLLLTPELAKAKETGAPAESDLDASEADDSDSAVLGHAEETDNLDVD